MLVEMRFRGLIRGTSRISSFQAVANFDETAHTLRRYGLLVP